MHQHRFTSACLATCFLISSAAPASEETVTAKVTAVDVVKNLITLDDLELDVARKTKITVDGEKATLADVKVGQQATVTYDEDLGVVASIVVGAVTATEFLNLEELNTSDGESAPFLSADGLEIFWVVGKGVVGTSRQYNIWSARRKNADALFSDKKQLYSGHAPVLSADGLELYFRSTDGEVIKSTTRKSSSDDFGRPRPVTSLSFPGQDAAPRWIANDSLTLYLDMQSKDGLYYTWEVNRSRVEEDWNNPKLVDATFDGMPKNFQFTQVSGSADNLSLYCSANFPPKGVRIGILSRKEPSGPFTQWTEIPLRNGQGQYPSCLRPTFVPATSELFLMSGQLFADPTTKEKQGLDLWVIKNFEPPIAK